MKKSIFRQSLLWSAMLWLTLCIAQKDSLFPVEKFKAYTELPRETIYVHLNKSILLKGEMLGFTAYAFGKNTKTSALQTTTIYCTIADNSGKVIKKKMLKVEKGIAYNHFNIDSLFTSGSYTFRAYSNWILNFNEPNYFETTISIIDPELVNENTSSASEREIDIQVLPEGGHLVENCQNTIAIIAKDSYGYGIPDLNGKIVDGNDKVVASFKLNSLGIGRTIFTPATNNTFTLIVNEKDVKINRPIENIKSIGFNISALVRKGKLILSFKTNEKSLDIFGDEQYNIVIHNGKDLKMSAFSFNGKSEVIRVFDTSTLFNGVNIITIFNNQNKPILERLFFNYKGIKNTPLQVENKIVKSDSITITLSVDTPIDFSKTNNLSVSTLPSTTNSYTFNSNIKSKIYLEPYLNGFVENASYYFKDTEPKTKYALDNLLISQGWSSYDWNEVFNNPPVITHNFEDGISANININDEDKEGMYLTYPLTYSASEILNLDNEDSSYRHEQLFPIDDEEYKIIRGFKKSHKSKKPNIYVQFFPNSIPEFQFESPNYVTPSIKGLKKGLDKLEDINPSWGRDVVELNEVTITANIEQERIEKLSNKFYGDIDIFDDQDRRRNLSFAHYISTRGFFAQEFNGNLIIRPRVQTSTSNEPLIFLDDTQLINYSAYLYQFYMSNVDYIVVNSSGFGEGVRGAAGVIRIYTNPALQYSARYRKVLTSVPFPLTFNSPKKFYTPEYSSYTNNTFRDYGVIDWKPNLQVNKSNEVNIRIPNTFQESIILHIEGVINGDTLLSERKIINFNNN